MIGIYNVFTERLPLLIVGEDNVLPEDVGGESGYEDFLDIMANPAHEEYEYITLGQKAKDIENLILKRQATT